MPGSLVWLPPHLRDTAPPTSLGPSHRRTRQGPSEQAGARLCGGPTLGQGEGPLRTKQEEKLGRRDESEYRWPLYSMGVRGADPCRSLILHVTFIFNPHWRTCLMIYREGEEGRERNIDVREISISCLSDAPQPGPNPQPRRVP
ncbi:hypothetical protein HJG60_007854 [Phyllostomus discolor]|uniref:Uncharacterized protein n=1 Tax=Phyllostomus discolor TaxID=89673 RepID=A0A834BD73_9CHIR|nr:hypothetical protein HJG60_007854 [Phyllostomus discolor]